MTIVIRQRDDIQENMAKACGSIHIGISGWRYAGWRGVFYPPKLKQRLELEYAASRMGSVEINGTFYSLQRPESFRAWREATPEDFCFAVKGPRFITHMKKLRNIETPLANFCANGMLELGPKLGPVLWQVPPMLRWDRGRFESFFHLLPRTQGAVAKLARTHDDRLNGRLTLQAERGLSKMPVRHCMEVRHDSFACAEFIECLRQWDVGLVVADTVEWPLLLDVTSDVVYVRLHGSEQLYASQYGDEALGTWADRIVSWSRGEAAPMGGNDRHARAHHTHNAAPARDVYVYFDNDSKVHAPFDAIRLQQLVDMRLGRLQDLPPREEPRS